MWSASTTQQTGQGEKCMVHLITWLSGCNSTVYRLPVCDRQLQGPAYLPTYGLKWHGTRCPGRGWTEVRWRGLRPWQAKILRAFPGHRSPPLGPPSQPNDPPSSPKPTFYLEVWYVVGGWRRGSPLSRALEAHTRTRMHLAPAAWSSLACVLPEASESHRSLLQRRRVQPQEMQRSRTRGLQQGQWVTELLSPRIPQLVRKWEEMAAHMCAPADACVRAHGARYLCGWLDHEHWWYMMMNMAYALDGPELGVAQTHLAIDIHQLSMWFTVSELALLSHDTHASDCYGQ